MAKNWTREQVQQFIRENSIKDGESLENALSSLYKGMIQAVLEEEMSNKLGYQKYDVDSKETDNTRNGHTRKTVKTKAGPITIDVPRDANGDFEPVAVRKHDRTLSSKLENAITSMYAKGMSTRDINAQMSDHYGLEYSAEEISRITDGVLPLAREWQNRPLDPMYPLVLLDGVMFSVMQDGQVVKKTLYVVHAITIEGKKDVLGIWLGEAESAKFWLKVLTDLKNRGVKDILIASVDGLKGFEEAITAVFPKTEVQQCIVHQVRTSTKFVNYKDLKLFCAGMKEIYRAPNEEAGKEALDRLEEKWGKKYSYAIKSWRNNWGRLATFFKYPDEVRRIIYTTNAIEGLNRRIRKITKTKGTFPTDDSLIKIAYLAISEACKKWTAPIHNWGAILSHLRAHFGERVDNYLV